MRFCVAFLMVVVVATAVCCFGDDPKSGQSAKDRAVVETLLRLKGVDVNSSANWKSAVMRHLETLKGTPRYVELVEKLKVRGVEDELFRLAMEDPSSTTGSKAAALLAKANELSRFEKAIEAEDDMVALKATAALGSIGDDQTVEILKPLLTAERSGPIRIAAANGIGKNLKGQQYLLELAKSEKLPSDVRFTAANILLSSTEEAIRKEAANYLSLPPSANSEPLPPIGTLLNMKGDASRGKQVFQTTGTCAKCHKVLGEGKEVGPDLSEIGSKLAPDAQFISILDPSAGISHNFESYTVVTVQGNILTGLMVNRTDQSVTIRTQEGIDKEIPTADIEEIQKSKVSLMPADLQKLLTVQDLVDVVTYLQTLKKAAKD